MNSRWLALGVVSCLALGAEVSAAERLDFRTHILPILTKAGCNAGACHGAAVGQGGFRLSLLGYDPEEDFFRITRELGGRRLDLDAPDESLLLRMARGELDHEGGRRLRPDAAGYKTVQNWIAGGAPAGARDLRVARIAVVPDNSLCAANETIRLRVAAELSDGTREDVTALALYSSNDDALAQVEKDGAVTTHGRGLTSIMVRYGGAVAAARVAVPLGEVKVAAAEFPAENFIDRQILATLQRLRVAPSPLSSDAEFVRRIHLDLIGRLPSAEEAREFLREPSDAAGRLRLIDRLLASGEFVDLWTMRFADLLLISGKRGSEEATQAYHGWLRTQITANRPLNEVARDLLTAEGEVTRSGPANFFTLATDPRDLAEHTARIFLGSQIACARCHAHPADRWTQDDYHHFAAYFARVTRDGGFIKVSDRGEVDHPKTGKPMTAKPLGGEGTNAAASDRRIELAAWMTAPENPFFARAMSNRVWKELLGRGLVEPVDDLRPTNPPTHPELLDMLAADFVAGGFDLRRLVRGIVASRTYQLTSRALPGNRADDRLCSHARLKPLDAQVLADAIAQATGVPDRFDGQPEGTRAVQLVGAHTPSYTLDVLGRCTRERTCDSPARAGGGIAQALHLINGPIITGKLHGGALTALLGRPLADRECIAELYLRTLTRPPRADELAEWEPLLAHATDRRAAFEDLFWALLNSREFAFNH